MSRPTLAPACRLVACLVILCFALPARGMVIDDFEVGPFSIHRTTEFVGPSIHQTGLDPAHVLLGKRSASTDVGSGSGVTVSLALTDGDDSGMMTVPAGTRGNWTGAYLSLAGTSNDSVGNVDLTAGHHNAIAITLSQVPASGMSLGIFLATDPIPGRRASLWRSGVTTPGEHVFRFSDLVAYSGESLPDLRDIDTLYVYAQATAGATPVTVGISDIRTIPVPEPAGGVALLLGVAAIVVRRRS